MRTMFQSTLPRGERHKILKQQVLNLTFQSTLPRGERLLTSPRKHRCIQFQSTLPRGERRLCQRGDLLVGCFNPRSRVGSDWLRTNTNFV